MESKGNIQEVIKSLVPSMFALGIASSAIGITANSLRGAGLLEKPIDELIKERGLSKVFAEKLEGQII